MVRDSLCCRKCGKVVDYSSARIDHIIPVKNFASFQQAHRMDNLQTLCVSCHQEKTNAERHSQR
jgi:5-methylcytosine-specific restriction endonuclease McrA